MKNKFLNMVEPEKIEINEETLSLDHIDDEAVAGRTLYTMVSTGTEFNGIFMNALNSKFPRKFGYTAVFQVEKIGKNVAGIEVGDVVFTKANHQSYQVDNYKNVIKVPKDILPEHSLFIRLAGVSMATLNQTHISPGELILVTGLGPVGFMAMQIYSNLGYRVIGVDPDENRRKTASESGFTVFSEVPFKEEIYNKKIALALECSGVESAVLDCCNIVRPRGEVSLVGVPWKKHCDIYSQKVLHSIFYNFVTLYSGWEIDLPRENSEFIYTSENQNYRTALRFIKERKMNFDGIDGIYVIRPYTEAQKVFEDIKNKKGTHIFTIFSWNQEVDSDDR